MCVSILSHYILYKFPLCKEVCLILHKRSHVGTRAEYCFLFVFSPLLSFSFFSVIIIKKGSARDILSIDETLDVAQPPRVLLLLLDVDVVGDEEGEVLGDAPLLEEALDHDLEVVVEAAEGGAGVGAGAAVGVGGAVELGDGGVLVEVHRLDDDGAVLDRGLDAEGAARLAGLLDEHRHVALHGGLLVGQAVVLEVLVVLLLLVLELLLGAGGAGAAGGGDVRLLVGVLGDVVLVDRVVEGGVVVGVEVHEVRDGEADGDSIRGVQCKHIFFFSSPPLIYHLLSFSPFCSTRFAKKKKKKEGEGKGKGLLTFRRSGYGRA